MKWKDLLEPASIPIALTGFVLAFSYSGILSFIPIYAKELGLEKLLVTSLFYTHSLLSFLVHLQERFLIASVKMYLFTQLSLFSQLVCSF